MIGTEVKKRTFLGSRIKILFNLYLYLLVYFP